MPRAIRVAIAVGIAIAFVPLTWLLLGGRADMTSRAFTTDFHDAQARAWLAGRWDLPSEVIAFEGWGPDTARQMYFGPAPSIPRLPVLITADAFGWPADGRLVQPFMLAALTLLLAGVGTAWWRLSSLVRGRSISVSRAEVVGVAAVVVVVGTGTVVTFLAAAPRIYHEAILWGAGLSLWALLKFTDVARRGRWQDAAVGGLLGTAAILSRASVGMGPVVAAGMLAAVWAAAMLGPRLASRLRTAFAPGVPERPDATATTGEAPKGIRASTTERARAATLVTLVLAALVPLGAQMTVNSVRFGEPFRLPVETFGVVQIDTQYADPASANGFRAIDPAFAPTSLLAYLRPDGLSLGGLFPWVHLPTPEPVGEIAFLAIEPTGSVVATMPLAVALGAVGVASLVRPGRRRDTVALRLPVLGAAAGLVASATFMSISHRYLGDWIPLLALAGLVGLRRLVDAMCTRPRPVWTGPVVGVAVLLVLWGMAVNVGTAVEYQRLTMPFDSDMRYGFVQVQHDLDGHETPVERAVTMPEAGHRGALVILDDCQALLWSNGLSWEVLEGEVLSRHYPVGRISTGFFNELVPGPVDSGRPTALCRRLTD
jgi:hypothetical protein